MTRVRICALCIVTWLGSAAAYPSASAEPAANLVIKRFVACPIYRDVDAGRKSSCWLASEAQSGVRYDIGESPVKPQLGRQVLVEGVVSSDPDICGGIVLRPVRASVLDAPCRPFMLPAEGYPGRRFVLPEVLPPRDVPRPAPAPPYGLREFTIYFEFGSDFLRYQHAELAIDKALTYIKASHPRRVQITAYADTTPFRTANGALVEALPLARARAEMVAEALVRLGIPRAQLNVTWHGSPKPDDLAKTGLASPSKRRATIRVDPG